MKCGILLCAAWTLCAAEPESPQPTHAEISVVEPNLVFCILDYGVPEFYFGPTSFWITASGEVKTQEFEGTKRPAWLEKRHEYSLSKKELNDLVVLLDVLRKDAQVKRERFGVPGEGVPCAAFSLSPHSDLFVREKWDNDVWKSFSALQVFLKGIHAAHATQATLKHKGAWSRGQVLWEPERIVSRRVISPLRYISSDRYNEHLEEKLRSEQGGGHKR